MRLVEFWRATVLRGGRAALQELDLTIRIGEHVSILGPNGCGKSTLIGTIQRDFYPLRIPGAYVHILEQDLWNLEELRSCLGIVKNDLLPPKAGIVSVREFVVSSFFGSAGLWNHQQPTTEMWDRADAALQRTGASSYADRDLDELSSGEARHVEIARALVHDPATLLLDEPTNHLDPGAQAAFRELVSELGRSGIGIIMVTHNVSDIAPECDRVVLLRGGKLFRDGSKRELLRAEILSELFQHPLEVVERDGRYFSC